MASYYLSCNISSKAKMLNLALKFSEILSLTPVFDLKDIWKTPVFARMSSFYHLLSVWMKFLEYRRVFGGYNQVFLGGVMKVSGD